jgi:hypothetical protein
MTTSNGSDSSDVDHPRSDDVQGRESSGYGETAGFGDRGYGDRGDFGDQGAGGAAERKEAAPDRPEDATRTAPPGSEEL